MSDETKPDPIPRSMPKGSNCTGGCGRERRVGPDFYVRRNGGKLLPRCKYCIARDSAKWRKENPEKHREVSRRVNHRVNLQKRFGITVEEFNSLVAQSDGRCGICRQPEIRARRISLDHDHKTGIIRGFLCARCNLALGSAGDDLCWLEKAIAYLKSPLKLRTSDVDPPVPMLLFCPICGKQHLDVGIFATKLHTTHACQHCGLTWRPAIVPTCGVQFLPGFKNDPVAR